MHMRQFLAFSDSTLGFGVYAHVRQTSAFSDSTPVQKQMRHLKSDRKFAPSQVCPCDAGVKEIANNLFVSSDESGYVQPGEADLEGVDDLGGDSAVSL